MTDIAKLYEELRSIIDGGSESFTHEDAVQYLKDKLAQPEQEPLEYWNAVEGWVKIDEVREHFDSVGCGTIYKTAGEGREPLYTTPPQRTWVGLTDEDCDEVERWVEFKEEGSGRIPNLKLILYIENKLKEKNS